MAQVAFLDTVHEVLWERLTAAGMDCVHAETTSRDDVLAGRDAVLEEALRRVRE